MSAVKKVEEFEAVGFVPVKRPDIPPYPMSKPFDWRVDPYDDSNWCFQLQTLRYLMIYQSAYRETGNEEYFLSLIDWFGDWWSSAKSSPGSYTWHDMATGIRAEKIHQLAKEIKASGIKKPVWFDEMIQAHVRVLRKKGFIRLSHNHGLYAVHGLRCLVEHLGPGMKKNVLSYAHFCFEKIIKNQFDENYVHKEHSPHYHHLVLRSLKEYKKTGLYDSLSVLDEYIEGAEKVAPNLYLPDGREIPFGDTDNQEYLGGVPPEGSCTEESLWCKSGYAVYKKLNSYLCATNSYNSNVHKHWDNLSLIWGERGFDILVDPGKYKYSDDDMRKRVLSSECHNTLNFLNGSWDGENIVKDSIFSNAYIEGGKLKVVSELCLLWKNSVFKFSRNLQYQPGRLCIIDMFSGCEPRPSVYSRFNFHRDFYVILESSDNLVLSNGEIDVVISLALLGEVVGDGREAVLSIESVPISYVYGSCENSLSVIFLNPMLTEIIFEVRSESN